jgi:hypothetical protein
MGTRLIYIPLSVTAPSHNAVRVERELLRDQDDGLGLYDQLRAEGWAVDSTSSVTLASGSFLAIILHRPEKMPLTLSQEFNEAYRTVLDIERDIGMEVDSDKTVPQHIEAVYQHMQQLVRDAETKHQPIGELNGTEED